jgi:hypothetical protein
VTLTYKKIVIKNENMPLHVSFSFSTFFHRAANYMEIVTKLERFQCNATWSEVVVGMIAGGRLR